MAFWKVVLEGTAGAQTITNILYYVDQGTLTATFDPAVMADLATEVSNTVGGALMDCVSTQFAGVQVGVSLISQHGIVLSPYEVFVAWTALGAVPGASPTRGACAILSFRVGYLTLSQVEPTPKRSYLAVGPLTISQVGPDGAWLHPAPETEALESAVSTVLEGVFGAYLPCRVGRRPLADPPAYGAVVDATLRPYVSYRRSRLTPPTGA